MYVYIGLVRKLVWFFYKILWKSPKELCGQPNINPKLLESVHLYALSSLIWKVCNYYFSNNVFSGRMFFHLSFWNFHDVIIRNAINNIIILGFYRETETIGKREKFISSSWFMRLWGLGNPKSEEQLACWKFKGILNNRTFCSLKSQI